jgi:hypothetical protein
MQQKNQSKRSRLLFYDERLLDPSSSLIEWSQYDFALSRLWRIRLIFC